MSDINLDSKAVQNELVITRIFDAPKELVWKAWTDSEHLMQWWGPKDFTSHFCKTDLRIGGKFHFCMKSSDGFEIWSTGVYKEVIHFDKLVFTNCFADEKGNIVPATHYGMPDNIPLEMQVTIILEDHKGKTKMTMIHKGLPSSETGGANIGWNESFDKLVSSLI